MRRKIKGTKVGRPDPEYLLIGDNRSKGFARKRKKKCLTNTK